MIKESTITNPRAFESFRFALRQLLIFAPIAGLTLLGSSVEVCEDEGCGTMATDGRKVYYAPSWVLRRTDVLRSNINDILHEFLHVFYNHPSRRGSREPRLWNYACDVRVAHDCIKILSRDGAPWQLEPDHVPALPWAVDLSAEQIYDVLKQEEFEPPKEYKPDFQDPPAETEEQAQAFCQAFTASVVQATAAASLLHKGSDDEIKKKYGSYFYDRLVALRQGRLSWGRILQGDVVGELGKAYATWSPPNFRYYPVSISPSTRSLRERLLIVGVDVSSSIDNQLIQVFSSNIASAAMRAVKTLVITFDEVVREVIETKDPRTLLRKLTFKSGSHSYTSTLGLFEIAEKRRPSAIAVLTDGLIVIPKKPVPGTHWAIPKDRGHAQPWGKNHFMESSW